MTSDTRTIEVAGSAGRPVRGTIHGPADAPIVLVAHGFKGFRGWGCWPWVCDQLAATGLQAIRFDFSHNGVEETDFDRLDLFLLDTPTRHQEDLRALVDALPGPVGILGHSRGGGDAILFAAQEPRVAAVATLASVATTRFEPAGYELELRTRGYFPMPNARTKQIMPIGREAFEDGRRHDIEAAAGALTSPLLLIHGESDESVPIEALERLHAAQPRAQVLRVPDAGHTFGAVHPWQGPTPALEMATQAAVAFFPRYLSR
jgi:pimeloyl-ACP methyl ester carboxylesterase